MTFTSGNGGDVAVSALGGVAIDGSGASMSTGILTNAQPGSIGRAGAVTLSGRDIIVSGGGLVSSGTAGWAMAAQCKSRHRGR